MDLNDVTLFAAVKKRLNWLSQRQEVLAQNIANSDTPKYRTKDLKPYEFQELIRRENMQLNMVSSEAGHMPGQRKRIRDFSEQTERHPFETAPDGNSVVLEEQLSKLNESQINHKLTTNLYKKHLAMIRMAIGRPR